MPSARLVTEPKVSINALARAYDILDKYIYLYSLFSAFSADLILFVSIDTLFLTLTKGLNASQISTLAVVSFHISYSKVIYPTSHYMVNLFYSIKGMSQKIIKPEFDLTISGSMISKLAVI